MQLKEGTFVLFVQFSEGTFALNMQFDKGTLRLFMQSDEGKLSFMSNETRAASGSPLRSSAKFAA